MKSVRMARATLWRRRSPNTGPALLAALLVLALGGCQGASHALPKISAEEVARANEEIDAAPIPLVMHRTTNEAITVLNEIYPRLRAAAAPICAKAASDTCAFNISYIADPDVNAWASGERDVTITSAIMRLLQNDDEVAAVVAHEMGHHIADHIDKAKANMFAGRLIGGLILGTLTALGGGNEDEFEDNTDKGMSIGTKIGTLSFSKEHEREADYLAAYLMARAGFDLERGGKVWLRLAKQPGEASETGLFDTHPASAERMAAWDLTIEEIKASSDLMPHWGK